MKTTIPHGAILYYVEEVLHYPTIKPDFNKELDLGAGLG